MKKKVLAIILTVALVISILPMSVLAEGPGGSPDYIYTAELGTYDQSKGTVWFSFLGTTCMIREVNPAAGYSLSNIEVRDKATNNIVENVKINFAMNSYTFDMPNCNVVVTPIFTENTIQKTIDISWNENMSLSLSNEIDGFSVQNKPDNKGMTITIQPNKTIPVDISFEINLPDKSAINVLSAPQNFNPLYVWDEPFVLRLVDLPKYFINDEYDTYSLELNSITSSAADELFYKITDNGMLSLNCIQFDEETLNGNLMMKLFNDYLNNIDYELKENEGASYIDSSHIVVWVGETHYIYKTSLVFEETDEIVLEKVEEKAQALIDEVQKTFEPGVGNIKLFEVTDLELISFLFDKKNDPGKYTLYDGFYGMHSGSIKYSSEFNEFMDFGNIEVSSDNLNFGGTPFWSSGFGKVYLYWNGVCYCAFNKNIGPEGKSVIYVPDDTPNGVDNFMAAAKERIEDYLDEEVIITKKGTLDNMDNVFNPDVFNRSFISDTQNRYGELDMENQFYSIKVGDREFYFLIARDSSKMKTPKLITKDIKTGASIESNSSEVPLDSTVYFSEIEEGTDQYSKLVSKIGLTDADVFDISLHSNVMGTNIKKLDNGLFEVRIPIKNIKYDKNKLKAYYVRDDGTIEMHDVEIVGGNAYFTTDHFSVYTIGEEVDISQESSIPKTGDNNLAVLFIVLALLSLMGVVLVVKKLAVKR